jgi:O-antigen/teichoic acid export membrane protein
MATIKYQAVSGVKWSTVSQVSRGGTQLLTTIILARLLSPSDFGLVGMAMVVVGFIGIFKDLGTSAAIIQRKEFSTELLSSIFWVNVGFGTLATLILFLGAPLLGAFYQEPRVVIVLRVLSTSFFISGLSILHKALLERSLSFKSLAILEFASAFIGAIVGVGLALTGAGVWSLVLQTLTMVSITTIWLWFSSSWRPRWLFNWSEVEIVSRFSLNLTGFSIFNYFARNADYLLIGRYLGAGELGYYTLAYNILLFPLYSVSAVIGRVIYPVLSAMQDDNGRFASTYLRMSGTIALVTFPMMAGVFALAEPFIITFFGEKWRPVILLVMILAPVGLVQSIGTTVGSIYQAKGRTDWMFRWGISSGIFVAIAFLIGLHWGIVGVAAAYAIATFIILYPSFAIPFRLIDLKFIQLLNALRLPFLNSSLMFVVLVIIGINLRTWSSNVVKLILSVMLGIVVYATVSWLTNREQLNELWELALHKEKAP